MKNNKLIRKKSELPERLKGFLGRERVMESGLLFKGDYDFDQHETHFITLYDPSADQNDPEISIRIVDIGKDGIITVSNKALRCTKAVHSHKEVIDFVDNFTWASCTPEPNDYNERIFIAQSIDPLELIKGRKF